FRSPGDVKYSCFAGNTTLRRRCNGMKKESATARWFPARITPPRLGTCSAPITLVGQKSRSNGPRNTYFISRYTTAIASLLPCWMPAPSLQPRDSTVLLCEDHDRGCTSGEEVSKTNSGATGDTVGANTLRGATAQGPQRPLSQQECGPSHPVPGERSHSRCDACEDGVQNAHAKG